MIDLRSDTVTKPTKEMLEYMMQAKVGDDVFGDDPTVNALQAKVAEMFGHEAALLCPSGTMTNQIAIRTHCNQLDEILCHEYSHIYQSEAGGYAANSGVAIRFLPGEYGIIHADDITTHPNFDWLPKTKLVVVENTCNKGGGSCYTLNQLQNISAKCNELGLQLHLDGARIFNAMIAKGYSAKQIGTLFNSISVCMSKGLGAPVGSLLIGSETFIHEAKRFRKVMGGGMRQAGYLAAACIYALDHNIDRLTIDHENALAFAEKIRKMDKVESVFPVETNIVMANVGIPENEFLDKLMDEQGILGVPFGKNVVRFTFHLGI